MTVHAKLSSKNRTTTPLAEDFRAIRLKQKIVATPETTPKPIVKETHKAKIER